MKDWFILQTNQSSLHTGNTKIKSDALNNPNKEEFIPYESLDHNDSLEYRNKACKLFTIFLYSISYTFVCADEIEAIDR